MQYVYCDEYMRELLRYMLTGYDGKEVKWSWERILDMTINQGDAVLMVIEVYNN